MPPIPGATEPLHDLVDESFDEAAFLWNRWDQELTSLTRNLDEIWSWTEDRLHGALDGIRVAGGGVIEVANTAVLSDERGRIAIGAGILAESSQQQATDALVSALRAAEGDRLRAMIRGLELLGAPQGLRAAAAALAARGPAGAGALCRLKAFRRAALGDEVTTAFASKIPNVQADAIRSVAPSTIRQFDELIAGALDNEDPAVRCVAVEAGVSRGIPRAWDAARRLAQSLDAVAAPYLKLLALLGTAGDHEVVYSALPVPALQLPAIWALGHIGTVRAVEACVAGMRHEHLARAAGEAYCWITGANLVRDRLTKQETAAETPPFENDDLDADLVPSPEALWPVADPDAVGEHWRARSAGFAVDARHILGRPVTTDALPAMVETAPMVRRPDLVLELRARTKGRYDVETRAFTTRQRQMMTAARAAMLTQDGR